MKFRDLLFKNIADNYHPHSLAAKLRLKRIALLKGLLTKVPGPVRLLDVGGTEIFWECTGWESLKEIDLQITLLNRDETDAPYYFKEAKVHYPNLVRVTGDARDMSLFGSRQFDVVFSNSVIEHLKNADDQMRMAQEVRRVGKRYFIQTPNLYFPVEPHFLFPYFQFLPLRLRVWMVRHFDVGRYKKIPDHEKAATEVEAIRLLDKKELTRLFPGSVIFEEKFLGLVKSFVAYKGF